MIAKVHEVTSGVRLIGIHGKAGSGKDTVINYLYENYQAVYRHALADPLKVAAARAFGMSLDTFHDPDLKEKDNDYWNISPRKIAQYFGTEMFRDHIVGLLPDCRSDFWIRRLTGVLNGILLDADTQDYLCYEQGDTVVVPDVRFSNEVDWIMENGGEMIWLLRPDNQPVVGFAGHQSEATIVTDSMYKMSNHSTLEELYAQVDTYAKAIGLIQQQHSLSADDF